MKVLLYNQFDARSVPNFEKLERFLEAGDFRSAEVKKVGENLFRARLDRSDRLLFSLYRHAGETYVLVLEHIPRHAYEKSRFLRRGVEIDESKLPEVSPPEPAEVEPLVYLNPAVPTFHVLDKVISFDDDQHDVLTAPPPFVVIGSAGSGKTALTLEKLKEFPGEVAYVTHSSYLVRNARELYFGAGYVNDAQEVSFLSFAEYLASLKVPDGRAVTSRDFAAWFARRRNTSKLKDAQQLFEEFRGVIAGSETEAPFLDREAYLRLGIKQSIFGPSERQQAYDLFEKYLEFLAGSGLYDPGILSTQYLELAEPRFDFLLVDEIQDVTVAELRLLLASLREPRNFILSGDANQIVHPNFFSWSKLKSFFHEREEEATPRQLVRVLNSNYRNSAEVTEVSNRILKLKTARFGSVDKESHYLATSHAARPGSVLLLPDAEAVTGELDAKTRLSTRFAVIVLKPEKRREAKARFSTPLVFSVEEAKGLEYDNIILYDFVSSEPARFREIARGVDRDEVAAQMPAFARGRDKSDKSLEIFKFYINALYVAVTRAVDSLYLVESEPDQPLFELLGLKLSTGPLELAEQDSSLESWRLEARKLELQGKQEQAEEIRSRVLKLGAVPWQVLTGAALEALERKALGGNGKSSKLELFEYALVYQDRRLLNALAAEGYKPATRPERGLKPLTQKYFFAYDVRKPDLMLREVERYGVDYRDRFNQTPLMIAARLGKPEHVQQLMSMGADPELVNNAGLNAFQIAVEQACADPEYAAGGLAGVYQELEPTHIVVRSEHRLIKLDNRWMEFLLVNLMVAMFYTRLGELVAKRFGGGITSGDLVDVLETFPDSVVPPRRKRRAYISSVLAKNEASRDGPYNRRLFRRVKRGHYVLNPNLGVWVEGAWRGIYELLSLDALGHRWRDPEQWFGYDTNRLESLYVEEFKTRLRTIMADGT